MPRITYIGSADMVDLDEIGRVFPNGVARGETLDVPAWLAGRAPEAAVAACEAELADAVAKASHARAAAAREQWGVLDHGEGLLAQVRNWQPAKPAKGKAESDGGEQA